MDSSLSSPSRPPHTIGEQKQLGVGRGEGAEYATLGRNRTLYWIHSHVNSFGGDPSRITLIGQSAGQKPVFATPVQLVCKFSRLRLVLAEFNLVSICSKYQYEVCPSFVSETFLTAH